jgi:hypothetical protein
MNHPSPTRKTLLNPSPVPPKNRKKLGWPTPTLGSNPNLNASQAPHAAIHRLRDQIGGISKKVGAVEKCVGHACQTYELWEYMQNEIRQKQQLKQTGSHHPLEWVELFSRMDLEPWVQFMRSPETIELMSYIARRNHRQP